MHDAIGAAERSLGPLGRAKAMHQIACVLWILLASSALLPVPARADEGSFVFDIGGGIPRLKRDDLKLSGDLTLGWQTEAWYIVASGSLDYYDLEGELIIADNLRATGRLSGAYMTGAPDDLFRFETELEGELAYYDSTAFPLGTTSGEIADDTSLFFRGTLFLGGRLAPTSGILFRALVGGGVQYESYSRLRLSLTDNTLADSDEISIRPEARMTIQWRFLPGWLSARLKARATRFSITRDDLLVQLSTSAGVNVDAMTGVRRQTELSSSLYLDLDLAELIGFVPSVSASLEYVRIDVGDRSSSTRVPILGVAIFRAGEIL